jgi:hypothetical protein
MIQDRSFLKEFCCSINRGIFWPFRVEHSGQGWDCATDLKGLVFVAGATVPMHDNYPPAGLVQAAAKLAHVPDKCIGEAFVGAIVDWAEPSWTWYEHPSGAITERVPAHPSLRMAKFCGRVMDRWLVWRFVHAMPLNETVRIQADDSPKSPVHICGDGWRVVLMPCRDKVGVWYGEPFPGAP